MEPVHTLGVRTSTTSKSEGRQKTDMVKKKRKILFDKISKMKKC